MSRGKTAAQLHAASSCPEDVLPRHGKPDAEKYLLPDVASNSELNDQLKPAPPVQMVRLEDEFTPTTTSKINCRLQSKPAAELQSHMTSGTQTCSFLQPRLSVTMTIRPRLSARSLNAPAYSTRHFFPLNKTRQGRWRVDGHLPLCRRVKKSKLSH